jgi:hypothetical protein
MHPAEKISASWPTGSRRKAWRSLGCCCRVLSIGAGLPRRPREDEAVMTEFEGQKFLHDLRFRGESPKYRQARDKLLQRPLLDYTS